MSAENLPESPCVSICTIDAEGLCLGCRRTLDEIELWLDFDEQQRRLVLARIAVHGGNR